MHPKMRTHAHPTAWEKNTLARSAHLNGVFDMEMRGQLSPVHLLHLLLCLFGCLSAERSSSFYIWQTLGPLRSFVVFSSHRRWLCMYYLSVMAIPCCLFLIRNRGQSKSADWGGWFGGESGRRKGIPYFFEKISVALLYRLVVYTIFGALGTPPSLRYCCTKHTESQRHLCTGGASAAPVPNSKKKLQLRGTLLH